MTESAGDSTGRRPHKRCDMLLSFGATPTCLPGMAGILRAVCAFMEIDKIEEYEITLALNEGVANSIEHAFRNDPEKQVGVRLSVDGVTFQCAIVEGESAAVEEAVMKSASIEEFGASGGEKGVGLTIIGLYMDTVERVRTEQGFEWNLTRRLRGGSMAECGDM